MSGSSQPTEVLQQLLDVLKARKQADPAQSYVAGLYRRGGDAILKKIGEEAAEVLIAAKNCAAGPDRSALVHELADLWFHTLVLMAAYDLPLDALTGELARRTGRSGLEEKASRTPDSGPLEPKL